MSSHTALVVLEHTGIFVFAISGAPTAIQKGGCARCPGPRITSAAEPPAGR